MQAFGKIWFSLWFLQSHTGLLLVLPSGRYVLPRSGNLFVWRPQDWDLPPPHPFLSELYFRSAVKTWGFLQAFNSEVFWKTVILFVLCCMHVVSWNTSVIIFCLLSIADISLKLQAPKVGSQCTCHAVSLRVTVPLQRINWLQFRGFLGGFQTCPSHIQQPDMLNALYISQQAMKHYWLIKKLSLMVMRQVYKIARWVVFTHKIAICGRPLVCSLGSEARVLSLNLSFSTFFFLVIFIYFF